MDVLAVRLAGQGLARRSGENPLRLWAIQDSPPGTAVAAVLARAEDASSLDDAIAFYNPRTATAVLPRTEAAAFGTALLPEGDDELKAMLGTAVPGREHGFEEPVEVAVAAISDALDGVTLSRDDLHEQLRRRLPDELLPWCEGCQSHHARRGLLVMASLRGRLCIVGRAGRQPSFARTDQHAGWDPPADAPVQLVRRYLAAYGPSTPAHFAEWAGIGRSHAKRLWALVDDWAPPENPPRAEGVRLLATSDPLLLARDRENVVPDPAMRKKVWTAAGGAGVVLVDGEATATWRARKQGSKLQVTLDGKAPRQAVTAEAERLAPHRGCASVEIAGA
jgi:hypothetical protein